MNYEMGGVHGVFDCLGPKNIVLYRTDKLWLVIDDGRVPFDDRVTVKLTRLQRTHLSLVQLMDKMHITVNVETEIIASWEYDVEQWDLELDFTPGVEEEHFDFGIFLKNLANDCDRRHRCYQPSNTR